MGKQLTHEEFVSRMATINKDIEICGTYTRAIDRIDVKCKYGHEWSPTADKLLHGRGCPICKGINNGNRHRKSHSDFAKQLSESKPNIELLSEYKGGKNKVKCRCKVEGCGCVWSILPYNLLYAKIGCPKCAKCYRRSPIEFVEEMATVNPNVEILSDFECVDKKVKCRCKIDNHIWDITPHELLNGTGCPVCNESKGEKAIRKWLIKNQLDYESQKSFENLVGVYGMPLSYDFYIPRFNILIEFQGEQHIRAFEHFGGIEKLKKQQEHDRRKREYAESHNIELLEIWYYDFDNIEEILTNKLGENQ